MAVCHLLLLLPLLVRTGRVVVGHPGAGRISRWSAPKLIGIAVDGNPSGRDAVVLGSLLARATGAELMLIAVHEEPLLPVALPGGMSWTALEQRARTMSPRRRLRWRPTRGLWFRRTC